MTGADELLTSESFTSFCTHKIYNPERLTENQIKSYGIFIDQLPELIQKQFIQNKVEEFPKEQDGIKRVRYGLHFSNVIIRPPKISQKGVTKALYPQEVKNKNKT